VCNESSSDGSTVRRRGRKKKRKDGLLTTGDMARLSNSTLRTVRFYEEADILHPVVRSDGGHRLFSSVELEKLLLVTDMRAAGLSLDEIKTILAIKTTSKTGVEAAQRVGKYLREQIRQMEEKVVVLQRLRDDFGRADELFHRCHLCQTQGTFPSSCGICGVMDHPELLPRTVRVLWNLGGAGSDKE